MCRDVALEVAIAGKGSVAAGALVGLGAGVDAHVALVVAVLGKLEAANVALKGLLASVRALVHRQAAALGKGRLAAWVLALLVVKGKAKQLVSMLTQKKSNAERKRGWKQQLREMVSRPCACGSEW